MSNPIKYSTGTESLALKKGNFYIGTGDVGKGPTSSTGYYNGISPPTGGYTIYLNKETGGPSIYTASNDAQLISLTNSIAGQSYTTVNECLVYYAGQSDKVCLNRDYEGIVTDGLVFNLDVGFTPSYPRSGTTWYDISLSGNSGTLVNGPTFNSSNSGSIIFDGTNEYTDLESIRTQILSYNSSITFDITFKMLNWVNSFYNGIWVLGRQPDPGAGRQSFLLVYIGGGGDSAEKFVVQFGESNGNAGISVVSSSTIQTDTIYNFTCTYKNGDIKLYQNGALVDNKSNTTSTIYTTNQNKFFIGGDARYSPGTAGRYFNGNVYNTKLYNRVLSASEVLQNFNAQKGRFGL
jgi:hypothetical protein